MASRRSNVLQERFFNCLISGDRHASREIVSQAIDEEASAEIIMSHLFWPTTEMLQNLHRNDQLSSLSYHYATRLLRSLVDQMQLRLEKRNERNETILLVCGEEESEELAAQMAADLLEADGYKVFFAGGGVANDEVVEQLGELKADKLVIYGAIPATVPQTRLLIDRLHEIGVCPQVQIIVGGGVFNRADGLAEEIGADLWAKTPSELVQVMGDRPERRMTEDQRTVGRKRRATATQEAA
ncbi:cobalamin B12-binding domain-containing protein [Poriferisphaera sp. WC338]|uniref:cobalamin B12-binding domain-containing protein n=1 Tax=Poriferisphaera sp. WC338 TaxID=3425129 RepID=UPI003D81C312